jgi:hypothetical protein
MSEREDRTPLNLHRLEDPRTAERLIDNFFEGVEDQHKAKVTIRNRDLLNLLERLDEEARICVCFGRHDEESASAYRERDPRVEDASQILRRPTLLIGVALGGEEIITYYEAGICPPPRDCTVYAEM